MRKLGALAIVILCSASAAADDRVDVNVGVDVNIHLVPPPPPPSDPVRTWMAVTGTYGYEETGFRVQLDLARGLIDHNLRGGAVYGIAGVAGSRGYAGADAHMGGDHVDVTDDRATGYVGIAGREGRAEARLFLGGGIERSVGTLHSYDGFMFPVTRYSPVAELGGEIVVRVVGRVGFMFGGRITAHIQEYQAHEIGDDSWYRAPGLEAYAGAAMLTE